MLLFIIIVIIILNLFLPIIRWQSSGKSRSQQEIKVRYLSTLQMMFAELISVIFCSSLTDGWPGSNWVFWFNPSLFVPNASIITGTIFVLILLTLISRSLYLLSFSVSFVLPFESSGMAIFISKQVFSFVSCITISGRFASNWNVPHNSGTFMILSHICSFYYSVTSNPICLHIVQWMEPATLLCLLVYSDDTSVVHPTTVCFMCSLPYSASWIYYYLVASSCSDENVYCVLNLGLLWLNSLLLPLGLNYITMPEIFLYLLVVFQGHGRIAMHWFPRVLLFSHSQCWT